MAQDTLSWRRRLRQLSYRYGVAGRRRVAVAFMVLASLLALAGYLRLANTSGIVIDRAEQHEEQVASTTPAQEDSPADERVFVHVDGAVAHPGVYELVGDDPRIVGAVDSAGGLTDEADTSALNLAAPVRDGDKVYVPFQGDETQPVTTTQTQVSLADGAATGGVNINTATADELETLPGVGAATASAIIEDREANGPFASEEDIMRVSGIGEKKYEKMRDMIRV